MIPIKKYKDGIIYLRILDSLNRINTPITETKNPPTRILDCAICPAEIKKELPKIIMIPARKKDTATNK